MAPDADECLPYYFQYIQLVPDGSPLPPAIPSQGLLTKSVAGVSALTSANRRRAEQGRKHYASLWEGGQEPG